MRNHILIFLFIGSALFGDPIDPDLGKTPIIDGWRWLVGDNPAYATSDWDDSPWYTVRAQEKFDLGEERAGFWMRLNFEVVEERTQPVYFFITKFFAPAEIFVNGVQIESRGSFPPHYYPDMAKNIIVKISDLLLRKGKNVIAIRSFYDGPSLPAPAAFFGGKDEYLFEANIVEFFNSTMYFFFGAVNLFTGIVFLIQFIYRRDFSANLVYALSSLIMAAYFFELGSIFGIGGQLFRHFAKACFPLGMSLLIVFFIQYFKIFNRKRIYFSILFLGLAAGLFLFFSPNETMLDQRFAQLLLPIQISILVALYMVVRSTFSGNRDAVPILAGSFLAVAFGSYDIVHFVIGVEPFAWLQGIGFFSLQMSMFVSLSIRSARLNTELTNYSAQLEVKKTELIALNTSLNRFVPQEFLSFLGKDSITQIRLGDGVLKEMTVLFSDIRSFTTLSERMTPDENFRLLNSYLSRMAPVIRESGGIIDKYIGDSIMALFPGSPAEAVAAALRMRLALQEYNDGRIRVGYTSIDMGIGLHSGPLMMGTIGEHNRMESTVISDVVNIASRLETLTKLMQVPILTSRQSLTEIPKYEEFIASRHLGNILVKGKTEKVSIYEVLSEATDPHYAIKREQKQDFEKAVQAYDSAEFALAEEIFSGLSQTTPCDPVAQRYLTYLQLKQPENIWLAPLS